MKRRHADVARRLRAARAPLESESHQRSWAVVATVYAQRPARVRRATWRRLALIPAVVAITSVLALTPAGATVHRWIVHAIVVTHPRQALFSLPTAGRVLVAGTAGTWTVAGDGARRRVGSATDATWSPRGLYVAVAQRNQLIAVTPKGIIAWSIARPDVHAPRWFAPNGYRIAYLSAGSLRVIAGDGTGDHQLAAAVDDVAPAWRPGSAYAVAYGQGRSVVVREADSQTLVWTRRLGSAPTQLSWSADGRRLLVLTRAAALVFDAGGTLVHHVRGRFRSGALSPATAQLALLGARGVLLASLDGGAPHTAFAAPGLSQLAYSPDGRWLLVSWPAADQWVFLRAIGTPLLLATSHIAQQFGAGGPGRGFPALEGWCCTVSGSAG